MAAFTASAVGVGSVRTKYEGMLQKFLKKAFEVLNIQNYLSAINCLNFSFESGILQTQQFSLRFWIER